MDKPFRIGITGSTGFVGKNLVSTLIDKFTLRVFSRKNIHNEHPNLEFSRFSLDKSINNLNFKGIDTLIHLAGDSSFKKGTPLEGYKERNIESTRWLIQRASECGVNRVIYLSTIKVHGEISTSPLSSISKISPEDYYSKCKFSSEQIIQEICNEKKLDYAIIRPPIIYGPGMSGNLMSLIKIINLGIPLPFKNIKNNRSFLFIKNLEEAFLEIIKYQGKISRIFTLADPHPISTPELISSISRSLNIKEKNFSISVKNLKNLSAFLGVADKISKFTDSLEISNEEYNNFFNTEAKIETKKGINFTVKSTLG